MKQNIRNTGPRERTRKVKAMRAQNSSGKRVEGDGDGYETKVIKPKRKSEGGGE